MNEFLVHFKTLPVFLNLAYQIKSQTFSHSYLILCEDEFSGKVFSKLVAGAILCDKKNFCFECDNCLKVLNYFHPDLYEYPKQKNFMVADASDLIDNAYTKPMLAENKVFVLNNFDGANQASQNKILKILEEPPQSVVFILNAKNSNLILPTIISRTQTIKLPPFNQNTLEGIMQKHGLNYTKDGLVFAEGWLGKAIEMGSSQNFAEANRFVLDVLKNMKTSKDVILFSTRFANKENFVLKLEVFERYFRNMLVLKFGKENLVNIENKNELVEISKEYTELAIIKIMEKILEAKKLFDSNVNLNLICDNLLISFLEVKYYANK